MFRGEQLGLDTLCGSLSLKETNQLSVDTDHPVSEATCSSSSRVEPSGIFTIYIGMSAGVGITLVLFKKSYGWDLMGAFSLRYLEDTVWQHARILAFWLLWSFSLFCFYLSQRRRGLVTGVLVGPWFSACWSVVNLCNDLHLDGWWRQLHNVNVLNDPELHVNMLKMANFTVWVLCQD